MAVSAIGATAPIVIALAVTQNALLRAVPFTTPLTIPLASAIFTTLLAVMVLHSVLILSMAIIPVMTPMRSVLRWFSSTAILAPTFFGWSSLAPSDLAGMLATYFWGGRPGLAPVRFPFPLLLVCRRGGLD